MKTRRLRLEGLGLLLLIVTLAMPGAASTVRDDWQEIERVIAIGDVHGDYDNFLAVLKDAEVVNRRGKWVAGEAHVVQVGDIPDRGPDTVKIIRFLQNLEKQAVKAGGRLHLLIGNHEHMN
ncbi:MAG: metallophosphoesterase, partial [Halieaceae bacterium]